MKHLGKLNRELFGLKTPLRAKINAVCVIIVTGEHCHFLDLNKSKGEEKARADPNVHFLCGDVASSEMWEDRRVSCDLPL